MIKRIETLCLHIKCHRTKIVGAHTAGHTVYWGIECVSAHSLYAGLLAASLGALTVVIYFLEKGKGHE